jgi:amino acid transporter
MFVNIAYFAVVPKEEIANSGIILAATFFKYAFGSKGETAASVFVALSALGNVLSVIFSQGRIIQSLGREGSLPLSRLWGTSKPFNTPFFGLFQHWIVCIVTILAPPPGDAYNFILNLISYPLNVVNTAIAGGLLYIYYKKSKGLMEWNPPLKATIPVTIFFFLSSLYLVAAPYIPPINGQKVYNSLPYWIHPVVAWGVFGVGLVYWFVWTKVLPHFGGYTLVVKEVLGEDGFWRNKFYHIKNDGSNRDILEVIDNDNSSSKESIKH